MKKFVTLLGASTLVFGILSSGTQAKTVYYEINGKRYSYNTNNRAEAAKARNRIQAAKAAQAAKAKADAEKASYPLVAAFGSKAQREATEAQEKLQELLSKKEQAIEFSNASADAPVERRSRRRSKEAKAQPAIRPEPQTIAPAQEASQPAQLPVTAPPAIAEPPIASHPAKKVRSVSFDVESGIKTTIMIDGTIEEEPFDSGALSQLAPEHAEGNSLMAFVKQLRKASPAYAEETTGSISPKPGEPETAQSHPRQPRN